MSLIPKKPFAWVLIAVVAYAYLSYYENRPQTPETEEESSFDFSVNGGLKSIEDRFKESDLGNAVFAGVMANALQKEFGKNDITALAAVRKGAISTLDRIKGAGDEIAVCGSVVTVHYDSQTSQGVGIDNTRTSVPISFELGQGQVIDALEIGLWGSKKATHRKIASPAISSYSSESTSKNIDLEEEIILINAEIIDIKNGKKLPKKSLITTKYIKEPKNVQQAKCGDNLKISYTISEKTGESQLQLTKNNLPLGLEMALVGMRKGEEKHVKIPQELMTESTSKNIPDFLKGDMSGGFKMKIKLLDIVRN